MSKKVTKLGSLLEVVHDHVVTLPYTANIYEAAEQIFLKGAKAAIIVDGTKRSKGMVLEQDVIRAITQMGEDIFTSKVTEIMRIDMITCRPDDSLTEGMEAISRHQMRHLPLLSDDGDLRGFVHMETVVKAQLADIVRAWKSKQK